MKAKLAFSILIFSFFVSHSQSISYSLNGAWQFKQQDSGYVNFNPTGNWHKAEVPGTVHTDLLANKMIPDPFFRDNESRVQWVEKERWIYKKTFDISDNLFRSKKIELQFDGLDTYAAVILNDSVILQTDNMFRQWTADVKKYLRRRGNVLYVVFYPAAEIAKIRKDAEDVIYPDNERVFVRKAQYHFGWDWGPRLVTCGIWKDVRLVGWDEKKSQMAKVKSQNWNVRLITEKDAIGESFYFSVNGKPTFIKGANWIPADNFLPRVKKLKRYEQLIKAAKDAHVNMLRVWGGGVYEDDEFYNLCDRYGIMVWQDFMFAGALYPADSTFLKNVEAEVRYQVNRLKHHPSIVLWCGNNEIEEAWFNWGWQKQFNYSATDSARLWNDYRKIFHQLIPSVIKDLDPERPYWPSSPSLGWGRDSAYKKGDVHYWGVWWGKEPVEKYNEKIGRFNSEYGMQGMPDIKTIKQFSLPEDRDTASVVMKTHQKHPFGYENIKLYIKNKFREPKTFEDLVYVSQLMQADAIKTAIEAHRRNKPVTMGTLFWQWNDCWPVVSWSAVDYYGRKKALYYQVKRSFEDLLLIPYLDGKKLKAVVSHDVEVPLSISSEAVLQTDIYDFNGRFVGGGTHFENHLTDFMKLAIDTAKVFRDGDIRFDKSKSYLKVILKTGVNGKPIDSAIWFFAPPKDLSLPKTKINYRISGNSLHLSSDKFAYGVFIDVPDGVELDDNYFHLLPGEKKIVTFTSKISGEQLKRSIKIKSLVDTY